VNEIRIVGRNTQGVRIMNLNEGDRIASIAKVAKEDEDESAAQAEADTSPEPPAAGEAPEQNDSGPEAPSEE
jgi:DNA gyrase subunit A